jgi:colanic acid/amylovoran biosynthesis glycosyltransferase
MMLTMPERRMCNRHILYVISRYTYRSTFIVREIEELAARGWVITVVSLRRPVFAPGSTRADLPYTVKYDSFWAANVIAAAVAAFASERRAIGQYVRLIASSFGMDLPLLARNLSVIPKACLYADVARRAGCRHIHAHWATVSTSAAMLISRVSGVPFSFTGHAWDIFCDTRLLAEKADAARFVLTCTAYNRRHLIEAARMDSKKVHVLYHGLRIPSRAENRVESSQRPLELLTVGRWSEKKGFLELIEALAIVRDEGVPFRLKIIAGEGSAPYERRVRQTIAARNLSEWVRTSGWLPGDRIEAAMRASDLFVLPCVQPANGAMDGIPNVLIEALSVGLPVVATRLSGIPELIRHGETGLLVNERDPRDLAATLVWCATHMAEMRRLAAQGRRLVERTFDIAQTISTLEEHFEAAIANGTLRSDRKARVTGLELVQ